MIDRMGELVARFARNVKEVRNARWARFFGYAVSLIMLGLIVRIILSDYGMVKTALSRARLGWLVVALGLNVLGQGFLAANWHQLLLRCGHRMPVRQAFRIYFLTGWARYLPGGVWHFGGRVVWLGRLSVPLRVSMYVVAIEQGLMLWVALVFGLFFSFVGSLAGPWRQLLLGTACATALAAAGIVLTWTIRLASGRDGWSRIGSFGQIVLWCLSWTCYGLSIYVVTVSLSLPLLGVELFQVMGYAALSWVVGYIIIFAPGGIGVRESILAALLGTLLPLPVAGIISLLARVVVTTSELVWALIVAKPPTSPARLPRCTIETTSK